MVGLIMRLLKGRTKHGKPDEELLWGIWEDRKYHRYTFNDTVKDDGKKCSFISFNSVTDFVWSFVRVFGLSTDSFIHSIECDNSGREYDCYYSQELAICGNTKTGEVEKVSYYGKNNRVLEEVKSFVSGVQGYTYEKLETGFMIVKNRNVNFELVKG